MAEPFDVFAVPLGPLQANCFVVVRRAGGLVIDPGDEADVVIEAFAELGFAPAAVLVTHGHFDHFGGVAPVAGTSTSPCTWAPRTPARWPTAASAPWPASTSSPSRTALTIRASRRSTCRSTVLAIPTPGHSRGSYTFAIGEDELFVGDLLFQGSVGRTDLPGGDMDAAAQLRRRPRAPLPAGRHRALRPRPGHVARPRARPQPVPLAAAPRPGAPLVSGPRAPKGTYDLLPDEAARRDAVVAAAARVFGAYGYRHIVTPEFEETALFERGVGEATDIVRKEMYTFLDKGDRSLTLRPEGTAPICRAYVEHGMHKWPQPVKLWYYCPMFRYEKPQAGRYREHYQIGAEAIGSADPAVDAEVIALLAAIFAELGVEGVTLNMNSMGDPHCRPAYVEKLREYLRGREAELCGDCRERIDAQPAAHVRLQGRVVPRGARRGAAHRRPPVPGLPRALRHGARAGARRRARAAASTSASCAAWTTTRARPSSSTPTASAPRAASAAAAATTASSSRSAARRRRAWASAAASSASPWRCASRSRPVDAPASTSSPSATRPAPPRSACAAAAAPRGRAGRAGPRRAQPERPAQAGRPQRRPLRRAARP